MTAELQETASGRRFCTMLGSGEGPPHGSWDLKGWGLTAEPPGRAASAAPSAGGRTSYTQALPTLRCDPRPRQVQDPGRESLRLRATRIPSGFGPSHSSKQSRPPSFHHLAVLWALGEFSPLLCPQTGRLERYLHVMSAAGAPGRGRAGGHCSQRVCYWAPSPC